MVGVLANWINRRKKASASRERGHYLMVTVAAGLSRPELLTAVRA
jgi:hypothetical protein